MSKFFLGEIIVVRNELNKIVQGSIENKLPAFLALRNKLKFNNDY